MSSENLLEEAKRKFAIQDVFLCDSKVWSSRKLALGSQVADPAVQYKLDQNNECTVVEAEGPNETKIYGIQYFVGTNVNIFTGQVREGEPSEDQLVATIAATFLVRYVSDTAPSQEMIQAFNDHAIHHIWPYWREYVESTTTRLRVPTVVIPLRVIATPSIPPPTANQGEAKG
jgi:hypothetical protein